MSDPLRGGSAPGEPLAGERPGDGGRDRGGGRGGDEDGGRDRGKSRSRSRGGGQDSNKGGDGSGFPAGRGPFAGLRVTLACGAAAQTALLALLALTAGLGPVGWVAGTAYLLAGAAVLAWALGRSGRDRLGPADLVTLVRSVLIGGVTALVADGAHVWPVVVLASVALALDLVDGLVARGTRTESSFGARFDMEADAFLILVLSVQAAFGLGWWVLAIGATRYVFATAAWVAPWLGGPLPPSPARKVVAAVQGVALVVSAAPVLPRWGAAVLVAGALGALAWSFGRDVVGLWRVRNRQSRCDPESVEPGLGDGDRGGV